jgi:hypothetical protein
MKRKHRDSKHYAMVHSLGNSIQLRVSQAYRRLVGDVPNLVDHLLRAPRGKALVTARSKEPIRD